MMPCCHIFVLHTLVALCVQSNCEWVNGNGNPYVKSAFDFRGISDYAPLLLYKSFTPDNTTADGMNIRIVITDDTVRVCINCCVCVCACNILSSQIVEVPDETFFVQLFLPGISPVWGSNMWSSVLIVDDGDGGVADRGYMEKMYAWEDIPALTAPDGLKGGLFGSEVAIGGPSGTILIAGAPGMPVSGLSSVGRVQ